MQNLFKVILCFFLIISVESQGIPRVATKEEYEIYQNLTRLGHFVAMDSINPDAFKAPEANLALRESGDPILIVYAVVKAVCYLWKGIVALFGYRVEVTYFDVPMDKGYAYLSQKIRIVYIAESEPGENCENLSDLAGHLCKFAGLKPGSSYYNSIMRAYENAKYQDVKVWGKKDFIFGGDNSGNITYCSIMVSKRDDDDYVYPPDDGSDNEEPLCTDHEYYYTLFLYMEAHLKLSANVHVERTEEHWGIWREKVTSRIVETPRGVETEDIETLFYFFNLVALKALAGHYGVAYDAPTISVKQQ